ncbi:MAG: methyltransferase domain-containing protein, partial [Planctomycetes bacterium]|nr:methyltransferase domain-containing protein [Planctomycetota bacterium]
YAELTGFPKHYDWVVASHVVEHTPDLVGFLNECDSILKDDGVLVLVVPDKRYCYDYFRPISGISKVIDAHLCKNKVHTIGTLVEDRLNASSRGGVISWSANATGEYRFEKNLDEVKNVMKEASESGCYIDSHAWCFVPNSFRLMIHDLYSLGLISFKEVNFFPTFGCEFCIVLGRKGRGVQMTRMEMLQQVDREICSTLPTFGRIWGLRLLNRIRRFI